MSPNKIARSILRGFHQHSNAFQHETARARDRFLSQEWTGALQAARNRIDFYDQRVTLTVESLRASHSVQSLEEDFWRKVKRSYTDLLVFHPQAELAETFYNSVFCKLFHRRYYHNEFIFVESVLSKRIPLSLETEYRTYFPVAEGPGPEGISETLRQIISDMNLGARFVDLDRDIELLMRAFAQQASVRALAPFQFRIDVLKYPFYRNKAAYVVGRIVTEDAQIPFVVPVLIRKDGKVFIDALITDVEQMLILFSFARAYFMVRTRAPSALVRFLQGLMPRKQLAELYSAIGLHKQGKTEFYRELLHHFDSSDDQLVLAPGIKGLVMAVFTMPSFPYVFKVIRDEFGPTKPFGRDTVLSRYRMVKRHDRVGRMADTIEYSDVALPLNRISDDLMQELKSTIASSMMIEGDYLVLKHVYIEKRLTPLNIYLEYADEQETRTILKDYGRALKDMLAANIFPGDMLLKNFGVTRGKRVVFYDYDEVQYLTDVHFRSLPKSDNPQEQLASQDWISVAPDDVFPEQITTFVFPNKRLREIFLEFHPELADASYWQAQQEAIKKGMLPDIFPYPQSIRFLNQFD
ncbi:MULTISPECIES: bifunctional isocitrate dehydrogenase kinase/phosphatase [Gammaproteobacteria]|uniref:bifunctional isocitrate dehydrogenase kinase/phosphatase n=1 Tax=Gammaproteobacteria TaxID=1236 RepID=UPI000DD00A3B|nr:MULTISPECIES: bifunctional isocitrate dehydrogenase kinase/phosphatase [Gammaproteobacteria]RTE85666.1 bifunctional isocitrate dehydrogenase kinase/phosphatase [Aliidiomarina sp. B3213]TCZ89445.1 bifunctional isocitrate dehydrogenase kinase/phosphatase [Lysobacter sp. N42]